MMLSNKLILTYKTKSYKQQLSYINIMQKITIYTKLKRTVNQLVHALGLHYRENITISMAGVHLEGMEDDFNFHWLLLILLCYTLKYRIFYQHVHNPARGEKVLRSMGVNILRSIS